MNAVAKGLFIGTLNRADARARAHAPWNDIKIARRWFIPRWYCPTRERALEAQRGKGARGKGLYGGVRFIADFDCSKRAAVLHGLFAPLVVFYDSRALDNSLAQCCRNSPADTIGMLLAQPHFCPSSVAASRGRRSLRASASLVLVSHGRDQRRWTRDSSSGSGLSTFACSPWKGEFPYEVCTSSYLNSKADLRAISAKIACDLHEKRRFNGTHPCSVSGRGTELRLFAVHRGA